MTVLAVVLDISAVRAFAEGGAASIAVDELIDQVAESGSTVWLPELAVAQARSEAGDNTEFLKQLDLLAAKPAVEPGPAWENYRLGAEILARITPGLTIGAAHACMIAIDHDCLLATFEPSPALQVVPAGKVFDLGDEGYGTVY